jgi:hypothetical protein
VKRNRIACTDIGMEGAIQVHGHVVVQSTSTPYVAATMTGFSAGIPFYYYGLKWCGYQTFTADRIQIIAMWNEWDDWLGLAWLFFFFFHLTWWKDNPVMDTNMRNAATPDESIDDDNPIYIIELSIRWDEAFIYRPNVDRSIPTDLDRCYGFGLW